MNFLPLSFLWLLFPCWYHWSPNFINKNEVFRFFCEYKGMVKILHKHKEVKRKIISMKNSPFLPILYVWFRIDNLLWVHCCFSISPMLYHKPLIVIQFFTLMILFRHLGVNKIKTAQTVNSNFEGFLTLWLVYR